MENEIFETPLISWLFKKLNEYQLCNPLEYNEFIKSHTYKENRYYGTADVSNSIIIKTKFDSILYFYHNIKPEKIRLEISSNGYGRPFYRIEIYQLNSFDYELSCSRQLKNESKYISNENSWLLKNLNILIKLNLVHNLENNWDIDIRK